MSTFLGIIVAIHYAMALFAVAGGKSDIQVILSALCVLTGTVALIGLAVLKVERLERLWMGAPIRVRPGRADGGEGDRHR
jgi:hypothetical protein